MSELLIITSDPEQYMFQIEDYAALSKIKQSLLESIANLERQGQLVKLLQLDLFLSYTGLMR